MMGILGSVGDWCVSPGVGSEALDEGAMGSAGGSPATEGSSGSDGASDEGSSMFFGEGVGLSLPGLPVLAGGATGSLGSDAGLAGLAEGEACSDTVVGSAGVGRAVGIGSNNAAGVKAIGGLKSSRVVFSLESLYVAI